MSWMSRVSRVPGVLLWTLLLLAGASTWGPTWADPPVTPQAPVRGDVAPAPEVPAAEQTRLGGVVASEHLMATDAGLQLLRQGGNAIDAAVGTALALAVVFPEAGNLAGGGFAVLRVDGVLYSLDFREVAPAGASATMYLDADGEPITKASRVGPLATGVPGTPDGLYRLHERFGRLPWPDVIAPARYIAHHGFIVDGNLHERLTKKHETLARFPENEDPWLWGGGPLKLGQRVAQRRMIPTLDAYAEHGPEGITAGPAGEAIVAASQRYGGILTLDDLKNYRAVWREPVQFEAFGWHFASMSLPSSGGVILGQSLQLLDALDWESLPVGSVERAHVLSEVLRVSFADRYLLGDPDTTGAQPDQLLAAEWLQRRQASISRSTATESTAVPWWPGEESLGASAQQESTETTHLSVIDAEGNAVALTTTLNDYFGSGLYVPEVGFLNNQMDDFATAPGRPNFYGLIQGEANMVRPGKRMLSSMSPTVAWRPVESANEGVKQDELIVIGGRGGSRIPTGTLQVLLGVLIDDLSLQEAVSRPRLHHQWLPDRVEFEEGTLDAEAQAELARRGHELVPSEHVPKIQAARRHADGSLEGARDRRGPGHAEVLEPR